MINFKVERVITDMNQSDKPAIIAHLQRLDSNDRYLRFFAALSDYAIESYVNRMVDFTKSVGFGIYDYDKKTLIAFAHLTESENGEAELGISIDAPARGSGLVQVLMERILVHVKANGIHTLYMACLRDNKKMQKVARNAGLDVVIEHDEAIAMLNLSVSPFEQVIYRHKEFAFQQVTIFDRCYRQNAQLVEYLFTPFKKA